MGKFYCDWLSRLKKGDDFIFVQGTSPNFSYSMGKIKGFTKTKIRTSVGEFEREGGRSILGSQHGGMLPPTESLLSKIQESNDSFN